MSVPMMGRVPFKGRGPFKGRQPFSGKSPFGFNEGNSAFWDYANLFASQASYDAYLAQQTVSGADKVAARMLTQAVLQTLGITNSVATTNPPGTVVLRDGTVGYGAHNYLKWSEDTSNVFWGVAAGATKSGANVLFGADITSELSATFVPSTEPTQPWTIYLKITGPVGGKLIPRIIFQGITISTMAEQTIPAGGVLETVYVATSNATASGITVSIVNGSGSVAKTLTLQRAALLRGSYTLQTAQDSYVPTTSAAVYAPRLTYDRGATQNMLLNSATLSTQTVTVVSGQTYTISALGTGTVTLSSGGAGTLTCNAVLRNQVTFVASGTSVVCTVSGSVLQANFNPGYATNYLATTSAILYTNGTPRSQNLYASSDLSAWSDGGASVSAGDSGTPTGSQKLTATTTLGARYLNFNAVIGTTYTRYIELCAGTVATCGLQAAASDTATVVSGPGSCDVNGNVTGLSATVPTVIRLRKVAAAASEQTTIYIGAGRGNAATIGNTINVRYPMAHEGTADLAYYATTGTPYSEYPQAGLLREVARTNSIRNNTMVGAVAGSPGTLPTNWAASGGGLTGLTRTIAVGTENGAPYIDLRYNGTSAGGSIILQFDSNSVAASAAQDWTGSVCARLAAGTLTGLSAWALNSDWGAPGYISTTGVNQTAPGAIDARMVATLTAPATTTLGGPVFLQFTAGAVAVDFTLRIKLPQWELGAFVTSPIRTTTAAVTRDADRDTGPASLISSAGPQTVMWEGIPAKASGAATQALIAAGSSGIAAGIDATGHALLYDGTNTVVSVAAMADGVLARMATRYGAGAAGVSLNGGTAAIGSFDGGMGAGAAVGVGDNNAGSLGFTGLITRLAISTKAANDTDLQLAAAGGR